MDTQVEAFIKLLNETKDNNNTWISRKEIASWSTILVYIGIMASILKGFPESVSLKFLAMIFIPVLGCVIILFIQSQFSLIVDTLAKDRVLSRTIITLIKNNNVPVEYYKVTVSLPDCLIKEIVKEVPKIRKLPLFKRIFLYFYLLKDKNKWKKGIYNYSLIEREEALIYDIIILLTIGFCLINLITNIELLLNLF